MSKLGRRWLVGAASFLAVAAFGTMGSVALASDSECGPGNEDVTLTMPPGNHQAVYSDIGWDARTVCFKVLNEHGAHSLGKSVALQVNGPDLDAYWTRDDDQPPSSHEGEHPYGDDFYAEIWTNAPYVVYIRPSGVTPSDVPNWMPNRKGAVPDGGSIPAAVHGAKDKELFRLDVKCAGRRWISVRGVDRDTPARLIGVYGEDRKRVLGGGEVVDIYHGHEVARVRGHLDVGTYWVWVKARKGEKSAPYRLYAGVSFDIANSC